MPHTTQNMAIVGDAEGELSRLWTLVCELSEQLNNNKAVAASLQAQANALKVRFCLSACCFAFEVGYFRDKPYTMALVSRCGGSTLTSAKVSLV